MNRNLGIERVYTLGEYRTLRVSDMVNDLPEELAMNEEFVDAVRRLQLVSLDLVHQKYLMLTKDLSKFQDGSPERYNTLLGLRANVMEDIQNLLNKTNNKE